MDYNTKLKNLRSAKNETIENIKILDKNKLEEIEEAKRLIEEKYLTLELKSLDELNKNVDELCNYSKLIEEYSTMYNGIFDILLELISIYEGEPYVLEKLNYHKNNSLPSEVWNVFMIMSKSTFQNIKNPRYVKEGYYYHLLKSGLAIKVIEDWSQYDLPDKISFYKTDNMSRIIPQINFNKFPYVNQFIDYVINYRLENNIKHLSKIVMYKLKDEFILLNFDNICNNYKMKEEQKLKESIENINTEYEHKQKVLRRIVKRIEGNN